MIVSMKGLNKWVYRHIYFTIKQSFFTSNNNIFLSKDIQRIERQAIFHFIYSNDCEVNFFEDFETSRLLL